MDKHFPHHHQYHKLFNRNNIKNSYSCMGNMATIISGHNVKILNPAPAEHPRTCNCRRPNTCLLSEKCLTKCVVYKVTVTAPPKSVRHYYGLTEGPFKSNGTLYTMQHPINARRCDVCLTEKMVIATANPATMLSKRAEIVSPCRPPCQILIREYSGRPHLNSEIPPAFNTWAIFLFPLFVMNCIF